MSHAPERKEKDCLNCGTIVQGLYCHQCGQQNTVPHESFFSLVQHFFADITHFDGKFFTTLGTLLRKPGFLSSEFVRGRRNSYLNPIRMYVFTSALFFLIFFMLFHVDEINAKNGMSKEANDALEKLVEGKYAAARTKSDSLEVEQFAKHFRDSVFIGRGTAEDPDPEKGGWKFSTSGPEYRSQQEYDSIQNALPENNRDGWIKRKLAARSIYINTKYQGRQDEFWKDTINRFLHTFPYLLFVSLPLYALFLKLLYTRRKNFYYADHAIFLIHLYIFTFINLLLVFGLSKLQGLKGFGWLGFLAAGLIVYGVIYTIIAMKRFYKQGWGKTILKFSLFNILCFITLNVLFAIFFTFIVYRV